MASPCTKDLKDVTDVIGGYGPWQRNIFILVFFIGFPSAWNNLVISFLAPNVDFWCARPQHLRNTTLEDWKRLALPPTSDIRGYSQCSVYRMNDLKSHVNLTTNEEIRNTTSCHQWEYDHSFFLSTIVEEWDLVCEKSWLISTSQSIYMIGYLVAVVLLGHISDRFGRRPTMLLSIVVLFVSGISCAFSTNFAMFNVTRFLIAFGRSGLYVTAFVLLMETVGPSQRPVLGLAREYGWATGYVILPGLAWLIRDWRYLQLAISLPVAGFICMWWLMPESPRWLLTQRRMREAEDIIRKACIANGKSISSLPEIVAHLVQTNTNQEDSKNLRSETALDLFKTPNMRIKTLVVCFNWFVNAFIFYGLSLNTGDIGGSLFINFFISGAVEFPAYVLFIFITRSVGRRIPLVATMTAGGLSCIFTIPVPNDMLWMKITLAMIGKFCITASYGLVYVFSAEIYPTSVRNVGVGLSSTFARIGSVIAPFVKELGQYTHPSVPLGLFGILSIVGGFLFLLLPETNNKILPNTLEQGEHFGRIDKNCQEKKAHVAKLDFCGEQSIREEREITESNL